MLMLFHGKKVLTAVQRCAILTSQAKWTAHAFHTSQRLRKQYLGANQQIFNKIVLNEHASNKLVLVDFYADWCGPCRMISPILERLTGDDKTKTGSGLSLDLVTIDTDKEMELAQKYQVTSLPTVMAFKGGEPVNHFIGALNEGDIKKFLQEL